VNTPIKKHLISSAATKEIHEIKSNLGHHHAATHHQPAKKKKEKLSALCRTPPSIVRTRNGRDYRRGNFLGEGGFARCFQMKDSSGHIYAAKTVAKASIKNEKTKTKLLSEIKIHKSLKHANIVNFVDCFEDDVNVYILLEICPNQSLMELLKTRKRITEPEVRYFMVQIVGAIKYLHSVRVIHRDLKLGNIFFDPQMNLKIGDFGLASILPANDSKKYTICGTPNYIAPEVLGGKNTGHSFEVDIWAIGIMMYALLIGKPPFQAKDVQVIYERIKKTEYSFPSDKPISDEAKVLIKDLLSLNPLNRPTVNEILNYDWFKGPFPDKTHELSLVQTPPNLENISKAQSQINFTNTKTNAGIYTPKSKNPVEILRSDLHSEQPTTLLPTSLSPNDTKNKYQEVDPNQLGRPSGGRRTIINSYSTTIKRLNQISFETYQNMRRLEYSKDETIDAIELPRCENPTLISKWVDYSNKYGFSYQLNNDDIGVLFNDQNTILKLHNSDRFLELFYQESEGWTCIENSVSHPPSQAKRQLEIVDFFAKYMNSNLSNVSENEERKETIFLRRYTRTADYIMFEMTNGTFQFNFKDHHKICISKSGLAITHVSPNRITQTHPLILILKQGNFPNTDVPDCLEKISTIKEAIKRKAFKET
jgi:cell cycle serine/threonine-protein kinase CDC5/MSD2